MYCNVQSHRSCSAHLVVVCVPGARSAVSQARAIATRRYIFATANSGERAAVKPSAAIISAWRVRPARAVCSPPGTSSSVVPVSYRSDRQYSAGSHPFSRSLSLSLSSCLRQAHIPCSDTCCALYHCLSPPISCYRDDWYSGASSTSRLRWCLPRPTVSPCSACCTSASG